MSLSSSVRKNLNELQNVAELLGVSSERITTGKKVNSALDNATSYYAAQDYTSRADSLASRVDSMQESVQVIKSADNGISTINTYLDQMQGIVSNALSTTDSGERRALGQQYNELIQQINSIAQDSGYGGINLLTGNNSLKVEFGENVGEANLSIEGINIQADTSGAIGGELGSSGVVATQYVTNADGSTTTVTTAYALTMDNGAGSVIGIQSAGTSGDSWEIDWGSDDYQSLLSNIGSQIETFSTALQTQSSSLASSISVITTREDFTDSLITILQNGATSLTAADTEEEAANLTSLQTSQELAVECLSLASENAQHVLSLIT